MTVASNPSTTTGAGVDAPPDQGRAGEAQRRSAALGLDAVWLAGTLTFAFLVGTLLQAEQTDYWWTVKLGQELMATGRLPAADPLAFTSTREPYVEQQWLAQLLLAGTHALGGLEAALLLRALLLVASVGLLYHLCRVRGAAAAAACAACCLALLSIVGGAAIRPQLFAIPLFVLFLAGSTIWLRHTWTLAALPLGMVAWANLHGSFPLGIALLGAALVGTVIVAYKQGRGESRRVLGAADGDGQSLPRIAAARRLALLLGLCSLAPLVNPYGLGIVPWLADYLTFNTGGTGLATLSTEWLPTSIATAHGVLFFLGVLVLVAVLLRIGPPGPADCLRLLGFAVLALQAVRSTVWWALVMAPVLAWGLSRLATGGGPRVVGGERLAAVDATPSTAPPDRRGIPVVNTAIVAVFVLVAALSLPWLRPLGVLFPPERWPVQDARLPVGAADFAATLPATRLYNTMDWGGYLAWRLAPRQRLLVDGRFQLYPPELYHDYFLIASAGPGWAEKLAAYRVEAIVVSREAQRELLRAVEADGSWQAVYCDAHAAVYLPRAEAVGRAVPCGPLAAPRPAA